MPFSPERLEIIVETVLGLENMHHQFNEVHDDPGAALVSA
jgi:hypothetical protein